MPPYDASASMQSFADRIPRDYGLKQFFMVSKYCGPVGAQFYVRLFSQQKGLCQCPAITTLKIIHHSIII
jgi:hypothetical protein